MAGLMDLIKGSKAAKASDLAGNWMPASNTAALREEFRLIREEKDISWEDFVASKGHRLDANGNVIVQKQAAE